MIGAEEAASAAVRALRELGPGNEDVVAATAAAELERPIFVRRLDEPGQSYFLATWRDARGVVAVMQLDAADGAMRSIAALPKPVDELFIAKDEARSLVIVARGGRAAGEAELVWQPCRESTSPLQPLTRVPTEAGDMFVTAQGEVRDRLTPLGRG